MTERESARIIRDMLKEMKENNVDKSDPDKMAALNKAVKVLDAQCSRKANKNN